MIHINFSPIMKKLEHLFHVWNKRYWTPLGRVGRQFTVQNPSELYVLVSSALPTTRRDMTCTVLKAT